MLRSLLAVKLPFSAFAQNHLNDQGYGSDPESEALFDGVSRQTFEPWIRITLSHESGQQIAGFAGSSFRK
jgi:hypothetical protein